MSLKIVSGPTFKAEVNRRNIEISDGKGIIFAQKDVAAPETWSDKAVQQAARFYFRTIRGSREDSVLGLVKRVVDSIVDAALVPDVGTPLIHVDQAGVFREELSSILLDQRAAFNTPVWVNAGAELPENEDPQCSACFIQKVDDTMESIMDLQRSEVMLFRRGSGTGSDLSSLRPAGWLLSRGGTASGPVSFMRGFDGWGGVTKSGGSSRRAAKMVTLRVTHPDIVAFIDSKVDAGRMIRALVAAGWDGDFNAPATAWLPYQNANNSVRIPNDFMGAVEMGGDVALEWGGTVVRTVKARWLWQRICEAAWECGDPGLQFDDTINRWHCTPWAGRINSSNPCSEYMFLDDSACNLASLRLTKYYHPERGFDVRGFKRDVRTMIIAMEAIVSLAGYPTKAIAENSKNFRPLGIGFADLGALLMRCGIPYDSEQGRRVAGTIASLMTATAYATSAEIAASCGGPFPSYRPEMMQVIEQHATAAQVLNKSLVHKTPSKEDVWVKVSIDAVETWNVALVVGRAHGFRNAQSSLLAPTGTIGFLMDCDTTGVEPDTALVKSKLLAGGGQMRIVNRSVGPALHALGYTPDEVTMCLAAMEDTGELPDLVRERGHGDVFRTALGKHVVSPEGHVDMVAAVQPFLSGAVSKTVNLPRSATVDDVSRIYRRAYDKGLKAVAVYREGSKESEPLKAISKKDTPQPTTGSASPPPPATRRRLPDERQSVTRKFKIGDDNFTFTAGLYPDGSLGEVWISAAKQGSLTKGIFDHLAQAVSLAIQYGAPAAEIFERMRGTRFEPRGWTGDDEFKQATSPLDLLAQWIQKRFLQPKGAVPAAKDTLSGLPCPNGCGPMQQEGTCWRCPNCQANTGGCGG